MRILYALQATGNGHISRANELLPLLEKYFEIDVLLSGTQAQVSLNHFIKYRRKGLSLVPGKKGGIDFLKTLQLLKTKQFLKEVKSIPVEEYDLVINDFEPLSAWACKVKKIKCLALSHQFAVISKLSPKPKKFDPMAWMVLRYYAPCNNGIGFHFQQYDEHTLFPVIRTEIRNAYTRNLGHYVVYLPAYSDKKLIKILSCFPAVRWHIFSRHSKKNYSESNCWIRPINNYDFVSSFTTCEGIICGAGFETPAEAIFMNKKLLALPMKGQYEQQCNAAALEELGITVMKKISLKKINKLRQWICSENKVEIHYEENSEMIIEKILEKAETFQNIQSPVLKFSLL